MFSYCAFTCIVSLSSFEWKSIFVFITLLKLVGSFIVLVRYAHMHVNSSLSWQACPKASKDSSCHLVLFFIPLSRYWKFIYFLECKMGGIYFSLYLRYINYVFHILHFGINCDLFGLRHRVWSLCFSFLHLILHMYGEVWIIKVGKHLLRIMCTMRSNAWSWNNF